MEKSEFRDRIVPILYAVVITLYVGWMSSWFFGDMSYRIYLVCGAVLFITSFFLVHIYYKVRSIEDKLNEKRSKKRRSVNKDGRSRKKD
jgi:hypothetical protein